MCGDVSRRLPWFMISGEEQVNSTEETTQYSTELTRRMLVTGASTSEADDGMGQVVESAERWRAAAWFIAPLAVTAVAVALWAFSLSGINIRNINDYGLVSVLPPTIFAAMLLLTASFSLTVTRRHVPAVVLVTHVIALIIIVHGTTALLYELPRYSWTYKHVGVVDYIMRNGSVNPAIDIYHNWPGFFALSAFFTSVSGLESPLNFAGWAPLFFNVLYIAPLLFLFRTFSTDKRVVWLGVWFFYLTSWVGQDYFAPQALAYFFYIVVLGTCVAWFRPRRPPAEWRFGRSFLPARLAALSDKVFIRPRLDESPAATDSPLQRLGAMAIIILIFTVVVSSHQLTPYAIIASIASLVIFHRCNARLLPVLMVVITGAWALYMAATYMNGNIRWIIQSIGELLSNVDSNVADLSQASAGRMFTAEVSRGLTAALWGLALLGTIRRFRAGHPDRHILLLAVAPFPLIATQTYGGEMIFRIFLFTLPAMAFLAASAFIPSSHHLLSRRTSLTLILVSCTLLGGLLFAYYGKERANYFTHYEMQAVEYLYQTAPKDSLILVLSSNLPLKYGNYEQYNYHTLTDNRDFVKGDLSAYVSDLSSGQGPQISSLIAMQTGYIEYVMSDLKYPATYLLITRSQQEYVDLLDIMPDGSVGDIRQALLHSARFRAILSNPDATIFVLAQAGHGEAMQ